ncbi:MAG: hypothetical protein IT159_04345 [Bryobacterales bacterium]|nr:hypothetical protein [Bryobacterales bacterium]
MALVVLAFFLALIVGMFRPNAVLPAKLKPSRVKVGVVYGALTLIIAGVTGYLEQSTQPAPLETTSDVFANIPLLQSAASPVLPSADWVQLNKLDAKSGFVGGVEFQLHSAGLVKSVVEYFISGKAKDRVDQVKISAFIASPEDLATGTTTLEAAAAQWFKSVGVAMPEGLDSAIRAGKDFDGATGPLGVEYVLSRGNPVKQPDGSSYRVTLMDLTIKRR